MANNPNVGPKPVEAEPNHVREKTYAGPTPPAKVTREQQKLPERTAEEKVREDMPEAVEEVKKRL